MLLYSLLNCEVDHEIYANNFNWHVFKFFSKFLGRNGAVGGSSCRHKTYSYLIIQ